MGFARTSTLVLASVASVWASGCGSPTELSFDGGTGGDTSTGATSTGSGSGGAGTDELDASCVPSFVQNTQIQTDLFVLQDKSESMLCSAVAPTCTSIAVGDTTPPSRWDAVVEAMGTFVDAVESANKGVGIGFFDLPTSAADPCNADAYALPGVPIAPLPDNRISSAIAAIKPSGGNPILPALLGSLQYARQYAMGAPRDATAVERRNAAVVLVTDGYAGDVCPGSTVEELIGAVEKAFVGSPPIRTYVVGIGAVANLDSIAHAGVGVPIGKACPWSPAGTTECALKANSDLAATLPIALKAVAGIINCDYTLPTNAYPKLVNVEIKLGRSGEPAQIGKVDNAAACGVPGGWYYDNPMTPTQIMLCPQFCGELQTTPGSTVAALYGCPSMPPPQ